MSFPKYFVRTHSRILLYKKDDTYRSCTLLGIYTTTTVRFYSHLKVERSGNEREIIIGTIMDLSNRTENFACTETTSVSADPESSWQVCCEEYSFPDDEPNMAMFPTPLKRNVVFHQKQDTSSSP